MLRSPKNPRIAFVHSLRRGAVRRSEGRTLVEGCRLVAEALRHARVRVVLCEVEAGTEVRRLAELARAAGIEVVLCSPGAFSAAAATETPQGILAVIDTPQVQALPGRPLVLVIDAVQDPGNMGTLLRSAAAAGATEALCTHGAADPFGPKAMRAGAGAQFRLPVTVRQSAAGLRRRLSGLTVYAALPDGALAYTEVDWTVPSALAIGSEAQGLAPDVRALARDSVQVPMRGDTESLNAAAAAAVILFEAARQRATGGAAQGSGVAGTH